MDSDAPDDSTKSCFRLREVRIDWWVGIVFKGKIYELISEDRPTGEGSFLDGAQGEDERARPTASAQ